MKRAALFAAVLCLSGCAGLGVNLFSNPTSAQQTLYGVESDYVAALQLAVDYRDLPECVTGGPVLCSTAAGIARVRAANAGAVAALNAAQAVVRAKGTAAQVAAALGNAQSTISALVATVAEVKK